MPGADSPHKRKKATAKDRGSRPWVEKYAPWQKDRRSDCLRLARSNPLVWVDPDHSSSESQFYLAAREWMQRYPQPTELRGIMVAHLFRSTKIVGYLTLMARRMLPRGIVPIVLDSPVFCGLWNLPSEIEALHGIIEHPERQTSQLVGDSNLHTFSIWSCDWKNKKIVADDLNVFFPLKERLGKAFRCYNIDINDEKVQARLIKEINLTDVALEGLRRAVAAADKYDLDVYCTGQEPNYTPTGAYYFFCRDTPRANPEKRCDFVQMNEAYDNYFTAGKMGLISAFTGENLTQKPTIRSPQYATLEMFEDWLEKESAKYEAEIRKNAEDCLAIKRVSQSDDEAAQETLQRIIDWRKNGGTVAVLMGKGTFDLGNWEDGGLVHDDMVDWLNHTIESVRGTNTLLLIKPHPTELLDHYYGVPNEYFVDLITVDIPENVIILDTRWFNLVQLLDHVDLVTLWTGTASIEALIKGVPAYVASHWRDYPLDFPMASTRDDYKELLAHPDRAQVGKEQSWRAASYLFFLRIGPHKQPLPYLHQISKRMFEKELGKPSFVEAEMERYMKEGDPRIDGLVARVFR